MRLLITIATMLITLVAPAQKQRYMYDGKEKIYYNTIADAEEKLINYIKQNKGHRKFPERYFVYLVENDERSLDYSFSKLQKAADEVTTSPLKVQTTKDGRLRFYTWDIELGTMSNFSGITQFKEGDKVYAHSFISSEIENFEAELTHSQKIGRIACGVFDVKQLKLNDERRVYITFSFSAGSSILVATHLEAYTINEGKLKRYNLFVQDSKPTHCIEYFRNPASTYIGEIELNDTDLYIPETHMSNNPYGGDQETERRLYYQFDGSKFNYTGIVYPDELHRSLCNFKHNIIIINHDAWTIRLDRMPNGVTRYASWKNKRTVDAPDLVIKGGTHSSESIGKESVEKHIFRNGEYIYEVSWRKDYSFQPTNPRDWKVAVKRDNKVLMTLSQKEQ